jgi:hypothetical protein
MLLVPSLVVAGDRAPTPDALRAQAAQRVDLSHAKPVHRHPDPRTPDGRPSVRRGTKRVAAGTRPEHASSARAISTGTAIDTKAPVQRVGYIDRVAAGDFCDAGVLENGCGCEVVCDCPVEAGCGLEATCGIEFMGEPACGCEGLGCDAPGCGFRDPMHGAACTCNACAGGVGGFLDCLFPRFRIEWNRLDLFAGVSGFTGPLNFPTLDANDSVRRGAGSFGFYQGFNKGSSLMFFETDLAAQFGVRFGQANLSGSGFSHDTRQQVFMTSGLFRRVDYGFQYGVAIDRMWDDWYYAVDLTQIRGELSWVTRSQNVWGFKFAAGLDDDSSSTHLIDDNGTRLQNSVTIESMTQYRAFYRQNLPRCGMWETFLGGTERNQTILGMNLDFPIHDYLLWSTSATYFSPNAEAANAGHEKEAWNLSMGFTFRPGGLGAQSRYLRPLFRVADNGTMVLGRP